MNKDVGVPSLCAKDSLQQLYEQLAHADQCLTAGERLLCNLVAQIDEMSARGDDTATLDSMLWRTKDTLERWQAHQQEVLDAIERLKGA